MTTNTAPGMAELIDVYRLAGDHALSLVAGVAADQWPAPALGSWTVRMLVGHIGRSFTTVTDYLAKPAATKDVPSTADYYVIALQQTDSAAIDARAEQAAHALGDAPLATLRGFRDAAIAVLDVAGDPLITTIAGGMSLSDYLPTRIFELAVHSLDLARATDQAAALPAEVCGHAAALAAVTAVRRGHGETVLSALTGRSTLPSGFSVV